MALNEIFRVTVDYELPKSAASWSVYYKETTAASGGDLATEILGEAFEVHIATEIINMLSDDCHNGQVVCERVFPISEAKHIVYHGASLGQIIGPALPSNNSLTIGLGQGTLGPRHNGRIRIPGISEGSTQIGVVTSAFFNGPLTSFALKLSQQVVELSAGTGVFSPGVISAQVRDLPVPPAPKDWAGAFLPLTTVSASSIIGILRKRAPKTRGRSG